MSLLDNATDREDHYENSEIENSPPKKGMSQKQKKKEKREKWKSKKKTGKTEKLGKNGKNEVVIGECYQSDNEEINDLVMRSVDTSQNSVCPTQLYDSEEENILKAIKDQMSLLDNATDREDHFENSEIENSPPKKGMSQKQKEGKKEKKTLLVETR